MKIKKILMYIAIFVAVYVVLFSVAMGIFHVIRSQSDSPDLPKDTNGETTDSSDKKPSDTEPPITEDTEPEPLPEPDPQTWSTGLKFEITDEQTAVVVGLGDCTDTDLIIPAQTPTGERVVGIGEGAFYNTNLESVWIPEGVTDLGNWAFQSCVQLKTVRIPGSVTEFGMEVFSECLELESVTLSYGLTKIGQSAFADCRKLQAVTIPDSVTEIQFGAFNSCVNLKQIVWSKSLERIDMAAFVLCISIPELDDLPVSLQYLGDSAFAECVSLKRVHLPKNVRLEESVFYNCTGISQITVAEENTAYRAVDGCLIDIAKKRLLIATADCVIPEDGSVKKIAAHCFHNQTALSSIRIPKTVTTIEADAFYGCTELTQIRFSGTKAEWKLTHRENNAFPYVDLEVCMVYCTDEEFLLKTELKR